ncbi:hypothetical protein ALT_0305 [Aspergillus lentulus]|uniref:O-methyltransferase domain-containing protein n=1 Tax=Aspergillus lentulus TaxID=293939 RepID=A0AAN4T6T1_ASPLE|nr:hypothetical protein ALT_0305 [Aspergillus lentulus]
MRYLIRRCLHNWPEDSVVRSLRNIVAAMEPEKLRLLIEEIIVPAEKAGIEEGWLDMIMMSLCAKQRTNATMVEIAKINADIPIVPRERGGPRFSRHDPVMELGSTRYKRVTVESRPS